MPLLLSTLRERRRRHGRSKIEVSWRPVLMRLDPAHVPPSSGGWFRPQGVEQGSIRGELDQTTPEGVFP
jgi:hypothetical protein